MRPRSIVHISRTTRTVFAHAGGRRAGTRTRRAHTHHSRHTHVESRHTTVVTRESRHTHTRAPVTEPKSIRRHTRSSLDRLLGRVVTGLPVGCVLSRVRDYGLTPYPYCTVLSRVRTSDAARAHVGLAPHPRLTVRRRPLLHATLRTHAPPVTRSASASSDPCLQREGPLPTHPTLVVSIRVQVHAGAVPRLELGDQLLL